MTKCTFKGSQWEVYGNVCNSVIGTIAYDPSIFKFSFRPNSFRGLSEETFTEIANFLKDKNSLL